MENIKAIMADTAEYIWAERFFSGREKAMKGKRFVIVLVLIALSLCGCNGLKKGQTYNLNDWSVNAYGVNIWWALNVL